MKNTAHEVKGVFDRLRQRLRGAGPPAEPRVERRSNKRAQLRIPVHVRVGDGQPFATTLHDISPNGLCFEGGTESRPDDRVSLRFEGYPEVCESFVLVARVVRFVDGVPARMAVRIDRQESRRQALEEYRKLVLHYLRHRPLLEKKEASFVEARCSTCGWVGRVPVRNQVCSRCGLRVKVLMS